MSEYYAVVRSTDHLAHYGVKGMKWGVRKALARGDEKALDRHFRRAARKLARLQDKGLNSRKYAAKAAGYGAAAAGAGTLLGTLPGIIQRRKSVPASTSINSIVSSYGNKPMINGISDKVIDFANKRNKYKQSMANNLRVMSSNLKGQNSPLRSKSGSNKIASSINGKIIANRNANTLKKVGKGAAIAGIAGLGALSARNAYIAANGPKYRKQAVDFKRAMDETFAGTKYQGRYVAPPRQPRKKRR